MLKVKDLRKALKGLNDEVVVALEIENKESDAVDTILVIANADETELYEVRDVTGNYKPETTLWIKGKLL